MENFIDNIYFDSPSENFNDDDKNNDDNQSMIDDSWIQEYEKLNKVDTNQERTFMDTINTYFVYINKNLYIDKILFEKIPLDKHSENKFSYISKEFLLKIIQLKKIKKPFSKYRLIDILSYVVNIEPELIQGFSNQNIEDSILDDSINNIKGEFLKVLPIINDISIDKSIFIFHNINSLYFIFQEVDIDKSKKNSHHFTVRSILKKNNKTMKENDVVSENNDSVGLNNDESNNKEREPVNKNHSTKKVRIALDCREQYRILNNKNTRKSR
jgi:hypothetical protein